MDENVSIIVWMRLQQKRSHAIVGQKHGVHDGEMFSVQFEETVAEIGGIVVNSRWVDVVKPCACQDFSVFQLHEVVHILDIPAETVVLQCGKTLGSGKADCCQRRY